MPNEIKLGTITEGGNRLYVHSKIGVGNTSYTTDNSVACLRLVAAHHFGAGGFLRRTGPCAWDVFRR